MNNAKTLISQNIHGIAFCINDYGVVITSESGSGKSDLALKLIDRGHKFIADDHVLLSLINNSLIIQAHEKLGGFIDIRDIGFVDVKTTYGNNSLVTKHKLNLIIELVNPWTAKDRSITNFDNKLPIGNNFQSKFYFTELLGQEIPTINLNTSNNRPLELLVELAVQHKQQLDHGYNSHQNFIEQQQSMILNNNSEP